MLNPVETDQDVGVANSLRRRVLAVLGLTQTVSWGILYYAFPVLAPSISRDTGWSTPSVTGAFSPVARGRRFALLAVALALGAFASTAALINLVPLLLERGTSATTAAAILGIGGAGQVAGRLLYPRLSTSTTPASRTALVLTAIGATIAGFAVVPTTSVLALVSIAVLAGAARGLNTLV